MKILELGIVKGGEPLLSKQFNEDFYVKDPAFCGGLISSLIAFVSEAFSDEMENFTMKNLNIVILNLKDKEFDLENDLFAYCIGNKKLKVSTAKKALQKVLDEFCKQYDYLEDFSGDKEIFQEFGQVIESLIK